MPSTFTNNTGIEKIADGEQSGLWGQTTNLNFDIIDRALNGSTSVSLSGTTGTLTTSLGTLSDGQFAVVVFSGSPSGTNTVTISPNTAQKTYWVKNTTAEDVVLSQGSGASVTVPPGAAKAVYANGAGGGAAVVDLTEEFFGNVTGNVTGNLTGNVTGNVTGNLTGNVSGNAGTATALQTARTIGGVSFNGTANINLPGVNQAGTQNTTGSAASLTTARNFTIGATARSFNGTAAVSWSLADIGVNNATLTLATSGIATGSQTFTANQGTNATFTVNVPATNLTYSTAASTGTVNSSTGTNATLPAATTSVAGLLTSADKTKLDGIAAGAQVNVATNLSVTGGTTAGPTVNSSTGTNATLPTASATASGVVTTGAQTFAGIKTFSSTISGSIDGNAGTATALQTARTIGGVAFDGTANINLPGVNQAGTQNTTGSAASLTTARNFTIGATARSFNGTAAVTWTVGDINAQLGAFANLSTNGLVVRTGTNTVAARSLAGSGAATVTNGNGVSGNPTVSVTELSKAQVEDNTSTVFGAVSGQRLSQAAAKFAPKADTFIARAEGSSTTWVNFTGLPADLRSVLIDFGLAIAGATVLNIAFSNDNGATWGSSQTLVSFGGNRLGFAYIDLSNGDRTAITSEGERSSAALTVPAGGANAFRLQLNSGGTWLAVVSRSRST